MANMTQVHLSNTESPLQSNSPESRHVQHGKRLLQTSIFSDCTIHCGSRSWHVHRAMLVPRCEFFRACFASGFREASTSADHPDTCLNNSSFQQPDRVSVAMHDDDPDAIDRMLRWMYTFSYPSIEQMSPTARPVSRLHASETSRRTSVLPPGFWTAELTLILTADKYGLTTLLEDAVYSLLDAAGSYISDAGSPEHCETFLAGIDDFATMLETLFSEVDPTALAADLPFNLQSEMLECTAEMISKYVCDEARLHDLMVAVPAFGIMLVQVLGEHLRATSPKRAANGHGVYPRRQSSVASSVVSRLSPALSDSGRSSASSCTSQSSSGSTSELWRSGDRPWRPASGLGKSQHDDVDGSVKPERVYIPMNEDSDGE